MQKKSFMKKFFVLLMVLCMTASYMPTFAFAAEEVTADAKNAAAAAETEQTAPVEQAETPAAEAQAEEPAPTEEAKEESEPAEAKEPAAEDTEQKAEAETDAAETAPEAEVKEEAKEETPAAEETPAEEALPVEEEQLIEEPETEDIPFNASKSDYLAYDPLYIIKYADPDLITIPDEISMDTFYKIPTAAKGIATYNVNKQSDFKVTGKNYIAGLTYEMPVYDIDPDGKYYVTIPNVNLFNDNFKAYDMQVAYNNDYAELISGWKYRKGILYIPKSAVDNPKNKREVKDGATIAVQLNYAIGGDMDFSKSIPVQILTDKEEPKQKTVHTSNIFDQTNLTVDTGVKGRKASDVKVLINGALIPIGSDAWTYHKGTGKIDIYIEPGIVSSINVIFARQTPLEKVKEKTTNSLSSVLALEAYADTMVDRDGMKTIKTPQGEEIVLNIDMKKMFVGWRGHYNASYMHGASDAKKESMLALTGWEESVYYLYGGYTTTAGIPEGATADKEMAPTWAFASYALAYNVGKKDGDTVLDANTNLTHWNAHSDQNETHTIYDWVQSIYADDLELSRERWGGGGTADVNGLGGSNNFAISLPKKIYGATTNLVSSGADASRTNEDIAFDSEILTQRQNPSSTYVNDGDTKDLKSGNYNYWIAASCNHLDQAATDDPDADDNDVFVTCLGMSKDYVVLAFSQSNPKYSQNACAIYKFKVESSGFAKLKKVSSKPDVLDHSGYSLAGAVYYLYTDAACTKRATDVDGNAIVLTTKANGETNVVEVDPNVTYYAKEITASPGFEIDTNVNGGKGITVTTDNDESNPAVFNSTEKPIPAHVKLLKKAAATNTNFLTEAPNNYTLKGAVYRLYTDAACNNQATDFSGKKVEFTTDEKGNTPVLEMYPNTYYAKEVTASKGFLIDGGKDSPSVYRFTLTQNHTKDKPYVINSTEKPTYGMANLNLIKVDTDGNYGWKKLIGAEYTLSYYDVDPNTTDVSGKTPKRTWTFATKKIESSDTDDAYQAGIDLANDTPVSGDEFYTEGNKRVLPIGVFTIEETKAPQGLAKNDKVYYGKVYQPSNGADAKTAYEGGEDLTITRTLKDDEQHPVIKINKVDAETMEATAQGTESDTRKAVFGSLAGAQYDVYLDDPTTSKPVKVGTITTDENGQGELSVDENGEKLPLGRYYIKEAVASPGYVVDAFYYAENPDKSFDEGQHIVVARATEINTGTFEYTVKSPDTPHVTHISKTDITTGEELPGALLQVIDSEGNVVEEWTSTDKPHDIIALHDETQGLKDGKYTLREITAPYGYDVAEDVEFEVKSDTIENTVEMKNKPITIGTTATDTETHSHVGRYTTEETVKDEVKITGLYAGRTYKVSGKMMDKATGEPMLDAEGNEITAEKEFTADGDEATIELEFKVDSSQFTKETTTVAFEKLYRTEKVHDVEADVVPIELQKHEDIDDEGQTIHYGGIASTTAVDKNSKSHNVLAGEHAVIIDTVEYKNLSPKEEYTLEGELYDKTTGELTGIKGYAKFQPEEPNGTVDVEFTFDARELEGHTLVAYETLSVIATIDDEETPVEIDKHEDPDDEDQTVHIPEIRTTATGGETEEHIVMAKKDVVIKDAVKYRNLIPGKEYTAKGKLVYKDNGNDVVVDGAAVTAEAKFTPEDYDGEVVLEFKFNAVPLAGKKIVAFEEVYEKYLVGVHADLEDKDQTVVIPKIGTTAIDSKTKDHVAAPDEEITVADTVKYEKLIPGKEYVMKGKLMQKSTGKALQYNGKDVTAETKFTPEKENGEVVLEFKCSGSALQGDALVAFEECYLDGVLVAAHTDLEDEEQSVHVPEIRTTAVDSETEDHISNGDDEVTIIDTVQYKSLAPGKEYTVIGVLMNKTTGEVVEVDGETVTAEKTFKPETADGSVDIEFTFDGSALRGSKVVAYEYVYFKDVLIAVHANINDEDQSVEIPKIATKVGKKSGKYVVDTVEYTGLIPGREYVMSGYFVSKKTEDKVKNSDGSVTFTPETPDGKVEVKLKPGKASGKLVAFEECYYVSDNGDEILVGEHKDIDDKAQTYTAAPKTGDTHNVFLLSIAFGLTAILSGLYYAIRRKQTAVTDDAE